jgi:carbonyl reductase 1
LTEWTDTFVYLGSRDVARGNDAIADIVRRVPSAANRIQLVHIDTSLDESVKTAASTLAGTSLYGIINNAGVGMQGYTLQETLNVNYWGPRRVTDAFAPVPRIVHVSSAAGPNFVRDLPDGSLKEQLRKPWTISGGVPELDELARTIQADNAYGCSKALLNAYTVIYGKSCKDDMIVNSCTPGFISTDLTAGWPGGKPVADGAIAPCFLLMDASFETLPRGRYYGSDCVRSPLDVYRGPGDEPCEDEEDEMQAKE